MKLSLPCKKEQIENCDVYFYDDGNFLVACFAENVPASVVTEIAKRHPNRAVFRDSSFANSAEKINVVEIFKHYAQGANGGHITEVKVI